MVDTWMMMITMIKIYASSGVSGFLHHYHKTYTRYLGWTLFIVSRILENKVWWKKYTKEAIHIDDDDDDDDADDVHVDGSVWRSSGYADTIYTLTL